MTREINFMIYMVHDRLDFLSAIIFKNVYLTQFTGRQFFGTELHSPYDVHFLKADGIWNAIVRLKRQVVESVYYINFRLEFF